MLFCSSSCTFRREEAIHASHCVLDHVSVEDTDVLTTISLVLRCGPFAPALEAMQDARLKKLLEGMLTQTFHISDGVQAIEKAQTKGVLKVQISMQ